MLAFNRLADLEVLVALGRHLGQVSHAEYLPLPPECPQALPDHLGDGAADAAVNFVENHGRHGVGAERGHFDRQADPGQFATRGHAAQRSGRLSWIG